MIQKIIKNVKHIKKTKDKSKEQILVTLTMTNNNIHCCISQASTGNVFYHTSGGKLQLKGSLKVQPIAFKEMGATIAEKLANFNIRYVSVKFNGFDRQRKDFLKTLYKNGILVQSVIENTRTPFNGCKTGAKRRI